MKYAKNIPQIGSYLKAAGHYEFGPQRQPIVLNAGAGQRIIEGWKKDEYIGYAIQWADLYRQLSEFKSFDGSNSLYIMRYEDLCFDPQNTASTLCRFLGVDASQKVQEFLQSIKSPAHNLAMSDQQKEMCWKEVEMVAKQFGYDQTAADS
jgi:hypothetical protein